MDTNNRRPNQSTEANMDSSDWRSGMQHETRQRIVSKIMDMLKRHLPVSGQEGMHQLWKIAQWFEDKCFNTTTSQAAYLRKISIKMLVLEARYKGTTANDMPPNQVEEEADCRICLLELRGADTLKKECSCKGELALVHQECAVKWFSIKGNRTCDVCKREVRNLPVSIVYK